MLNEAIVSGSHHFSMRGLPSGESISPGKKILIISQENDARVLFETLVEIWGYRSTVCASPQDFLRRAAPEPPALILLDSVVPFEAHLANVRRLRRPRFLRRIPLFVLSGFSEPRFKNMSLAVGADGFLVKPIDFDALENLLRKTADAAIGNFPFGGKNR
ncbi:MAG TPA: response regulator [Pyrinomonadaceae bacterium]|jgi:DNA-binding response OmpR family regulator